MSEDDSPTSAEPKGGKGSMAWGGRFGLPPAEGLMEFSRSIQSDMSMWREDLAGSRAHVKGLLAAAIITPDEAAELTRGLSAVAEELESGSFAIDPGDEDIHMAVERRLTEIVGEVGGKLHSGRSRNDQVALDLRLYAISHSKSTARALLELAVVLIGRAEMEGESVVSGYTHLQRAQPVLLAHHLLAHVWPLTRDVARLRDAAGRGSTSPLGAGALAGTSLPIDPAIAADELGLDATFENSIDAVADRDVALECLSALAIAQVHLSRLAEEIVIWASDEFAFITLSDEWSTGSSMMPQKKNPDVAELTRGRTGRAIGNLVAVLTTLKGLPLAYNRDLQEDKAPLFDSFDVVTSSAKAMAGLVSSLTFNTEAMSSSVATGFASATDLAEELVRNGLPFRRSHEVVGSLVARLELEGRNLSDLTSADLADLDAALAGCGTDRFTPTAVVAARTSRGSTAPASVESQLLDARSRVGELEEWARGPG